MQTVGIKELKTNPAALTKLLSILSIPVLDYDLADELDTLESLA